MSEWEDEVDGVRVANDRDVLHPRWQGTEEHRLSISMPIYTNTRVTMTSPKGQCAIYSISVTLPPPQTDPSRIVTCSVGPGKEMDEVVLSHTTHVKEDDPLTPSPESPYQESLIKTPHFILLIASMSAEGARL